jgi:hypothetical protein
MKTTSPRRLDRVAIDTELEALNGVLRSPYRTVVRESYLFVLVDAYPTTKATRTHLGSFFAQAMETLQEMLRRERRDEVAHWDYMDEREEGSSRYYYDDDWDWQSERQEWEGWWDETVAISWCKCVLRPEWFAGEAGWVAAAMGQDDLPVLADALADAGCLDEPLLAAMRRGEGWTLELVAMALRN